jgi:hypothetical protein
VSAKSSRLGKCCGPLWLDRDARPGFVAEIDYSLSGVAMFRLVVLRLRFLGVDIGHAPAEV